MIEIRTESGIKVAIITALRQFAINSRVVSVIKQAVIDPSRMTPYTHEHTKID